MQWPQETRKGIKKDIICYNYKKAGHIKRNCPQLKSKGNNEARRARYANIDNNSDSKSDRFGLAVSHVLLMACDDGWIIDSGTCHMCNDESCLEKTSMSSSNTLPKVNIGRLQTDQGNRSR